MLLSDFDPNVPLALSAKVNLNFCGFLINAGL